MNDLVKKFISILSLEEREDIAADVHKLLQPLGRKFQAVVVGPVNSGKSSIINKLLNRNLLPTSSLPSTNQMISITYGPKEIVKIPNSSKQHSITPDIWGLLNESGHKHDLINVELLEENLRIGDVALVDTPGLGASGVDALDIHDKTGRVLADADIAIVVLSATALPGLSMMGFLKEYIVSSRVPFIVVVLTHLDDLEDEASRVVTYLNNKLSSIGLSFSLFTLGEAPNIKNPELIDGHTSEDIWRKILAWSIDPSRDGLRANQQLRHLERLVLSHQNSLESAIALTGDKAKNSETALARARTSIRKKAAIWKEIALEFDVALKEQYEWVDSEVKKFSPNISRQISFTLEMAEDLKKWYESELPFRVSQELSRLEDRVNRELKIRVSDDFRELETKVNDAFTLAFMSSSDDVPRLYPEEILINPIHDQDLLKDKKRLTTLAITAVTVVSYFTFGQLAAALSVGGALLTKYLTDKAIKEQKADIFRKLNGALEIELKKITIKAKTDLRKLYEKCLDHLQQQEEAWNLEQENLLRDKRSRDNFPLAELKKRHEATVSILKNIQTSYLN